jgi:hypothetical protein
VENVCFNCCRHRDRKAAATEKKAGSSPTCTSLLMRRKRNSHVVQGLRLFQFELNRHIGYLEVFTLLIPYVLADELEVMGKDSVIA